MKSYELTYIISPQMTSEQATEESKSIEAIIQNKSGLVLKSEIPAPRTLAYPIKRQGSGFFGVLEFQLEPENLKEITDELKKDGKIARYMVTIKEPPRAKKERRTKKKTLITKDAKLMSESFAETIEDTKEKKASKKVELKEIEKELDEILND